MILRLLRDDWWKVAAYTLILFGNLVATVLAYPTFEANYGLFMNLVPDFLPFVKQVMEQAGGGKFGVFLAINHFFKGANVIGPAVAIVFATGAIAREVENGTLPILLARPVSRARVLLSFAAVHLVELVVPLVLVTATAPLLTAQLIGRDVALAPLLAASLHGAAFIALTYAIALVLSIVLTEQLKVAAVAGGICVVSFLLYFIEATRPYTLYRLSSLETYVNMARDGTPASGAAAVCVLGSAALLWLAAWLFQRRDY